MGSSGAVHAPWAQLSAPSDQAPPGLAERTRARAGGPDVVATAVAGPAAARTARAEPLHGERFALGLTAVAVAILPFLKPGGPGNIAPVDLVIGIALVACLLWAGASRARLRFPYTVGMGLLIVGGTLGALVGPVPTSSAIALLQDLWLLGWCWAVANIASSPGKLRVLLATWAYAATAWSAALIISLFAGWSWLSGQTASEGSRTALTLGDPSYAASYFFISIMIIWGSGLPRRRGARLVAYALLVVSLLSTGSNSGIVSLAVGVGVALAGGVWRRRGPVAAVAVAAFVLIAGFILASNINIERIQDAAQQSRYSVLRDGIGRSDMSAANRDTLLRQSIDLYQSGGPLGQGPVSTKTRLQQERAPLVKEAHDDYLAAFLERGALGTLGLLVLLSGLLLRTLPLVRERLADGFAAVVSKPHALLGALAGTIVAMSVYELLHVRHVWTFFALLAVVSIWGRR